MEEEKKEWLKSVGGTQISDGYFFVLSTLTIYSREYIEQMTIQDLIKEHKNDLIIIRAYGHAKIRQVKNEEVN